MPLCLCGQINLFKVEIILCSLSFACLLLFFVLSVVFATFLSSFTLFDCSKWQISYCQGQRSFSRFLLVEAEAVDKIAASTSLFHGNVIFYLFNFYLLPVLFISRAIFQKTETDPFILLRFNKSGQILWSRFDEYRKEEKSDFYVIIDKFASIQTWTVLF